MVGIGLASQKNAGMKGIMSIAVVDFCGVALQDISICQ